ncbi:MAG TPA: FAD-binding oxidoreductase, partial [Pirellulales bacterium]|nr:FAD-binding oxidoreductase [Pirellulales bacterium]
MRLWPRKRRWRLVALAALVAVLAVVARPTTHLVRTAMSDRDELRPLPAGWIDDASRMNETNIDEVWEMPPDEAISEEQLRKLLDRARREKLRVSIAGARHSMGGQTNARGGIQINMLPHNRMELDERNNLLHVQAGARWSEIIPYLDKRRRSVAVMQSNNSFTVGGSISVNCHGWQPNRPPMDSTVDSLRLMKADGEVVRCSRTENAELFSLVLGGYGLFGVILDADLRVVPNERYRVAQFVVPTDRFIATWDTKVGQLPQVGMACGRLSIVPGDSFLNEAILYVLTRDPLPSGELPALAEPRFQELTRTIFRGSVDSDYGKKVRWIAERDLQLRLKSAVVSRNQLLNEPAALLANRSQASTDILHEYFVPRSRFNDFLVRLREIIPKNGADLLNVTVRDVREDHDSLLRYADCDMTSLVMLFNQRRTSEGDK